MKRKQNGEDGVATRPSPKRRTRDEPFRESESVREQARPYLLAVGRLHIDVLETTWSIGRNRRLEPGHVRELKEAFMKGGLERGAPENRIFVLCTAEEVYRIRRSRDNEDDNDDNDDNNNNGNDSNKESNNDNHHNNANRSREHGGDEDPFLRWAAVNKTKVEVMAGQHRLRALQEYIKATGAPESDNWWTCELYDKDRLPVDLDIKLRINRRDPSLPDNHGQIWTQLVSIASDTSGGSTKGGAAQVIVDYKLVEALRLGGEKSFPTRRLVTLWNHERWRKITTRWCQTRLGLETFNISTFEWIASLRIDDYWLTTLEAALGTLKALPLDETQDLGQDDWNRLSTAIQSATRTRDAVEAIFFTSDGSKGSSAPHHRKVGLLETLDDSNYREVCRAVWAVPSLEFVDLRRFLRSKKPETEAAVRILQHVISWIHHASAVDLAMVNPKSKNKPQLLKYLQAALDSLGMSRGMTSRYPADAALQLQKRVLDFAQRNASAFQAPEVQAYITDKITLVNTPDYSKRFNYVVWARLLRIVRQVVDAEDNSHVLKPEWETSNTNEGGVPRAEVSILINTFCASLFKLGDRPVKKNDSALIALQRRVEKLLTSSTTEL
ncbi:uncharacterized protein CTRU02_215819 [Colletotrichum truncatum]|uniref:Uncharacterized protein n=1 Tax=Colletotrichum truncatum TaxID=5467 RepID=A0ACC3YBS4_COLTU